MPELTLNAQTSVGQLEAFARAAGNAEIRAKTDDNGVTTLYTHSKWKPSLNRDPIARATKQKAGREALTEFIKTKAVGQDSEYTKEILGMMSKANGGGVVTGKGLHGVAQKALGSFNGTMETPAI